jgi:UDP-N-acetylglucosamine 2-epimerase (non-hydrolysing)
MRVLVIAGARPNYMKVAPILRALKEAGTPGILVHTGQHYDEKMSDSFFRDLGIPQPDYHLGVGSGSHAVQTARVMEAFEPVLLEERPDWVVVVGDVNSTLACALVAAKEQGRLGCRIAHVEAGLRSGDWSMPEEVNRVLTDRLSDLLLTPSRDAHPNLDAEGIDPERVRFVGNVMIDTLFHSLEAARALELPMADVLGDSEYAVVTLHRPSNVDDPAVLGVILEAIEKVSERMKVIIPVHPRTRGRIAEFGMSDLLSRAIVIEPLGYLEMLALIDRSSVVLTDSGGLQEETTALGVPCLTLRESTERPITVTEGTNRLVPWPMSVDGILGSIEEIFAGSGAGRGSSPVIEGWDGMAAVRIVEALRELAELDSARFQTRTVGASA